MDQQTEYQQEQFNTHTDQPYQTKQQQYTTHINQLISQPVSDNRATVYAKYIVSSLYQLSSYLFSKKIAISSQNQFENNQNQMSFNSYLLTMGDQLGKFQKGKTSKQLRGSKQILNIQAELIKCYKQVDSIYFQQKFVFDYSYFQSFYNQLKDKSLKKYGQTQKQVDKLCQNLDTVELNLFSQIHCKFQQYFKVVANFQYLQESVTIHLLKLRQSRAIIKKIKQDYIQKSVILRKKIIQRQNIQKTLKLIKQIKSIKKLPQVLQSILSSSLPYEAISLLQQTKKTVQSLQPVLCLTNTSTLIKQMQALIENDITKKYTSVVYLYLEQCYSKQSINLQQRWKKINVNSCLDKDSSFVLDQLNSSSNSALSDNPQIFYQTYINNFSTNNYIPRNEGTQYQIAMIVLQSYSYINFAPNVSKIKTSNSIRLFCKKFQKQLFVYLDKKVKQQIDAIKMKQNVQQKEEQTNCTQIKSPILQQKYSEQEQIDRSAVDKISVQFYVKHLGILNEIFKQILNRFLGYLKTLIQQYEQQYKKVKQSQMIQKHKKFKIIFQNQCSLLPSVFSIIQQKVSHMLTLKNISNIEALQFYRWITTLTYWQKYFNYLVQEHPLLNRHHNEIQTPISQLYGIVEDSIYKSIQTMKLKTVLNDLTLNYINAYHKNTCNNQILTNLQEDTWQSTEVPPQFSEILQAIFNPQGNILNAEVTILDSSVNSSKNNSFNSSKQGRDISKDDIKISKLKIKLLKNNVMIGGIRYKINLSVLVLLQYMGNYVKMSRILQNIHEEQIQSLKIRSFVYEKIYDLAQFYCNKSKELILDIKALQFGKIKAKSINAKHICLLSNCLSVVKKIIQDILQIDKLQKLKLINKKQATIGIIDSINNQLINKLSLILSNKIQKQINDFVAIDKTNNSNKTSLSKTSNNIVTVFLQLVQITDDYLQVQGVRQVLKNGFQILSQRYITHLLLKGGKYCSQVQSLTQKLKFIKKYFPNQYQNLLEQIPKQPVQDKLNDK